MYGSNTISNVNMKEACAALQQAFMSGNDAAIKEAFEQFSASVAEIIRQDYLESADDAKVLASRGYRQLTKAEKDFYEKIIETGKGDDFRQAFSTLPAPERAMPQTVIEDVYRYLTEEHPLLSKISFQNVQYLTHWILSDNTVQKAAWGKINAEITQEITSSFEVVDVTLCKLTAYAAVQRDMLDLGPAFLDNYIRTLLKESIAAALEAAIIGGNGKDCPIGLDRDIHKGVSYSTSTGYPKKSAVVLNDFTPAEYGKVLAKLVKTEKGKQRKFNSVVFVCNMTDYLTKVMPSSTVLNANGTYTRDVFPFPTETVVSNELEDGKAILFLPEEYFMGIGSSKEGNIEVSDEAKFLEDLRLMKIKTHAMGRAYDNTVSVVLDINNLEPLYLLTKDVNAVAAASAGV